MNIFSQSINKHVQKIQKLLGIKKINPLSPKGVIIWPLTHLTSQSFDFVTLNSKKLKGDTQKHNQHL